MSFRIRIIAVLCLVCFITSAFYVGNKNNAEIEESKLLSHYQTDTVNLWYTDETLTDFLTTATVAFHEKYPEVRVIPTLVSGKEYLEVINEASLANENYPDLYILTNDSLEKAFLSGLASEVDSKGLIINANHFADGAIHAVTYKDKKIAYPLYFETSALVYNIDYLEEWAMQVNAGEDEEEQEVEEIADAGEWDEEANNNEDVVIEHEGDVTFEDAIPKTFTAIEDFSKEFDAPEGVEGIIKWDVYDIFYNYFFLGNYLSVGGENGDDSELIDVNNDDTISCIEEYQEIAAFFSIDGDGAGYQEVLNDFIDGKYVFSIVTTDAIKTLEDAKIKAEEEGRNFNYGYSLIPDVTDELKSRSLSVTNCLVLNAYSEKREQSTKFAEFLSTEYASEIYAKSGKIAASVDAEYTDDAFTVFQGEYAKSMPLSKIAEASNLWIQLEIAFKDVWDGQDAKECMDKLQKQLSMQMARE